MSRVAFAISLGVNAGLLGLIATAILVTVLLEPGEEALGWGLTWVFSLPLVIFLAALSALFYPRYLSASSRLRRVTVYGSLVVAIAAVAFAATYSVLR